MTTNCPLMQSTFIHYVLLLVCVTSLFSSAASVDSKPWKPWSCDELTPDLCEDLQVQSGSLVIRSIPVKYWRYKRRKDSDESTVSSPIIAVHGGPAWPHNYLLPLRQLACRGAEVIFYDQAGCGESVPERGRSVSPSDHPHLLTTAYYSEEELPALIDHWGLDAYHVIGSSWGTMLAQLFALNARNATGGRLRSLVLSGPLSDAQSYIKAQWDAKEGNLASLPPFVQERIRSLQARGAYDSAEYEAIDDVLATFFTLRTAPAPDCFAASAGGLNRDVYVGMQGASEFAISGVLGDFNVTGRLHEIDVPVLLTHGKFDTMRPSIVKKMQEQLKLSERVMLPHSGHVSMIDDAGMMNDAVADFLERVEMFASSDDGLDRFVPRGEVEVEEEDEIHVGHSLSWKNAAIASIAGVVGVVIGRMYGNINHGGYAQI